MNLMEPIDESNEHLELMKRYLREELADPAVAVCRYIKTIAPRMPVRDVAAMAGCLIGCTAAILDQSPRVGPADVRRLAAIVVACVLPAGADLGMQCQSA